MKRILLGLGMLTGLVLPVAANATRELPPSRGEMHNLEVQRLGMALIRRPRAAPFLRWTEAGRQVKLSADWELHDTMSLHEPMPSMQKGPRSRADMVGRLSRAHLVIGALRELYRQARVEFGELPTAEREFGGEDVRHIHFYQVDLGRAGPEQLVHWFGQLKNRVADHTGTFEVRRRHTVGLVVDTQEEVEQLIGGYGAFPFLMTLGVPAPLLVPPPGMFETLYGDP